VVHARFDTNGLLCWALDIEDTKAFHENIRQMFPKETLTLAIFDWEHVTIETRPHLHCYATVPERMSFVATYHQHNNPIAQFFERTHRQLRCALKRNLKKYKLI